MNNPIGQDLVEVGASITVPLDAPEAMWTGIPRMIMLWLDFNQPTPRKLFDLLRRTGHDVPEWMKAEGELQAKDHVPSKGTRCVLIYRAMLENWMAANPIRGKGA
jgi:hypothetical protein